MTGKADPDKPEEPIKVEPGQPGTTPIGGGGGEWSRRPFLHLRRSRNATTASPTACYSRQR